MMKNKNGTKIPEKRFLFVHSKQAEKKKTLISQGFLHGSGDRIRTNDTPGMKDLKWRSKQGFYIIWKGKGFDLCEGCGVRFCP